MKADSAKVTAKDIKAYYEFLPKSERPTLETYFGPYSEGYRKLNTFSVLAEKINGFKEIVSAPGYGVTVLPEFIDIQSHWNGFTRAYKIGRNAIIDHFITRNIPTCYNA